MAIVTPIAILALVAAAARDFLAENGLKFVGISLWTTFLIRFAYEVSPRIGGQPIE